MKQITHRSEASEIQDAILEVNRRLSNKVDELEEYVRGRTDAEEEYEGAYWNKVIYYMTEKDMNVTTAKGMSLTHANIRALKKAFELAKGMEDVVRKKIRSLETHVESLRSLLSYRKNELGRGV
jgi:hypothetical protein